MSSSAQLFATLPNLASAFLYRDVAMPVEHLRAREPEPETEPDFAHSGPTPEAIAQGIAQARAEAAAETAARLNLQFEARLTEQTARIQGALDAFKEERKSYFGRVESDVVHLALAIASKILHREAQVDPMLIAALVRVAVNKLHDGSHVTVRVAAAQGERWREALANPSNGSTIQVVEDTHLTPGDCILETDVGSADFSIEAQLKEVEQGFFDLLAQRPAVK